MRPHTALSLACGGLLALALWPALVPAARGEGEDLVSRSEPPLELYLEVEGREVPIALDRKLELAAPGGKLSLTLRGRPWRTLTLPTLTLRYPRAYHFEYVREEHHEQWTLNGSDTLAMLFHVPQAPGAEDGEVCQVFAQSMREQYGQNGRMEETAGLQLGGIELPGRRIRATLAGTITIIQDVYARVHGDGSCTVVVLQHTPTDQGVEPSETRLLRQQLVESLRWR